MRRGALLAKSAVQTELAYPAAYWTGLIGVAGHLAVAFFLWKAVFAARGTAAGYGYSSIVTYIVLAALLSRLNGFGVGRQLSLRIARGEIATDLIRPANPLAAMFAYNWGRVAVEGCRTLLAIAVLIPLGVFVDIDAPALNWAAFGICVVVGLVLIQLVDIVLATLALVTTNTWGIWILRDSAFALFSGAVAPLAMFPSWFQDLCDWLPFAAVVNGPLNMLIFGATPGATFALVGKLAAWAGLFLVIVSVEWRLLMRRVTIFGG
jgi:ABC-2 type transport system permease protein